MKSFKITYIQAIENYILDINDVWPIIKDIMNLIKTYYILY